MPFGLKRYQQAESLHRELMIMTNLLSVFTTIGEHGIRL
jgi:hypothetical protein